MTARLDDRPPGRVWAYRGSAAGRARLRKDSPAGRAVVSREYLDAVLSGVAAIAPHDLAGVERSVTLPVVELARIEIAPR